LWIVQESTLRKPRILTSEVHQGDEGNGPELTRKREKLEKVVRPPNKEKKTCWESRGAAEKKKKVVRGERPPREHRKGE